MVGRLTIVRNGGKGERRGDLNDTFRSYKVGLVICACFSLILNVLFNRPPFKLFSYTHRKWLEGSTGGATKVKGGRRRGMVMT